MLLISAILAGCFSSIKAGLEFTPPLLFGSLRAIVGGTALVAFARFQGLELVPPRRTWPSVLCLAIVATALTYAAMFLSPGRTEAGIASALGNLQPFITLILAAIFLGESLTARKAVVVGLGFAGVILISHPTFMGSSALGISGAILAVTVSLNSSAANVLVKRSRFEDDLFTVTAWQFLVGGIILLVVSSILEDWARFELSLGFIAILLFLGVLGTAFTTGLWFAFVQEGQVGRLATFFYLVPVFGIGIAALAFSEPLTLSSIGGALVILMAVAVTAFDRQATDT